MVLLFIIVSVSNNYAFSFHISMPLHMIFRAVSQQADNTSESAGLDKFGQEVVAQCGLPVELSW